MVVLVLPSPSKLLICLVPNASIYLRSGYDRLIHRLRDITSKIEEFWDWGRFKRHTGMIKTPWDDGCGNTRNFGTFSHIILNARWFLTEFCRSASWAFQNPPTWQNTSPQGALLTSDWPCLASISGSGLGPTEANRSGQTTFFERIELFRAVLPENRPQSGFMPESTDSRPDRAKSAPIEQIQLGDDYLWIFWFFS